jgi:pimeloyl-ACP methyl ester carboxylesterase
METLLELEAVAAEGTWTELPHGRLFHLAAGAGDPIVLLQGAGGGAANWYRLLRPLARSRRVYAPELPGFGLSDAMAPEAPMGVQVARVTAHWLDANLGNTPVDLLATSFGGLVALRLAQLVPERIRRIVLLNAAGLGRGLAFPVRIAGLPLISNAVRSPSRAGTAILFRTLLTADRSQLPAVHQRAIIDYTWLSARESAGAELARALDIFAGLRGQSEVLTAAELAGVRCPVLLMWGAADRFLPHRHGPRATAILPNATFRTLPGVGHSPNWEAPATVLKAIGDFLGLP